MTRRPPRSTLFPYTRLSRSLHAERRLAEVPHPPLLDRAPAALQHVAEALHPGGAPGVVEGDHLLQLREPVVGLQDLGHLDRKSTRLNSSHANISYAVFCLKN